MKRKYFLVISFLILVIFLTGCSGSGIVTPATSNKSPIASFTVNPASGVVPSEVYLNASGSYDSDGSIVSYAWDFKDGNTGNGKTINHTFNSIGSYNVELTVIDNKGATDSVTKTITVIDSIVSNQTPTAIFTATPTSGLVPLGVSFNASNSSDNDGNITSYAWDFKDGNTGNGKIINHTFGSAGSYNVKLTITDDKGATDSVTKTITVTDPIVSNQSPTASFTATPTSGLVPLVVYLNASGSYDSDGDIASYQWDFKDGNTGNGQTINHTFSSTGIYSVKLTVTDDKGATDATTKTITVAYNTEADFDVCENLLKGYYAALSNRNFTQALTYCKSGGIMFEFANNMWDLALEVPSFYTTYQIYNIYNFTHPIYVTVEYDFSATGHDIYGGTYDTDYYYGAVMVFEKVNGEWKLS